MFIAFFEDANNISLFPVILERTRLQTWIENNLQRLTDLWYNGGMIGTFLSFRKILSKDQYALEFLWVFSNFYTILE